MAKVRNTGNQPRGFIMEDGNQIVVPPGYEAEFNLTEADFKKFKEIIDGVEDEEEKAKLYELSGSPGGVKGKLKDPVKMADQKKKEQEADKAEAKAAEAKAEAKHETTAKHK